MTVWTDRPTEEARLFNPAFLVALIAAAAHDYEDAEGSPMPWVLSFLIPPLALAERTREALPSRISAHFPNWLDSHPQIRVGFARRARPLTPITREAIRVGLRTGALKVVDGGLRATSAPGASQETSGEVKACLRAARLLGRWFASRHDVMTTFGLLGVRP